MGWLDFGSATLLLILIVAALYRRYSAKLPDILSSRRAALEPAGDGGFAQLTGRSGLYTSLRVEGMTCNHCVANVEDAIKSVSGVRNVEVDLKSGWVRVKGDADSERLIEAVDQAGYKASS
jgi:copper ion binding protein